MSTKAEGINEAEAIQMGQVALIRLVPPEAAGHVLRFLVQAKSSEWPLGYVVEWAEIGRYLQVVGRHLVGESDEQA